MSAKLKTLMPIGSKWRVAYSGNVVVHGNLGQTTLKPYEGLREVRAHRSRDMIFRWLEGEKAGSDSYLNYPKSSDISQTKDGRIVLQNGGRPITYTPAE